MTYKEYKAKYDALNAELNDLIEKDAPDDSYNAKVKEIDDLNAKWDRIAQRKADRKALSDDNRAADPFYTGAMSMDMRTGRTYSEPVTDSDPMFLNRGESMVSRVKDTAENAVIRENPHAMGEVIRGITTGRWSSQELKNAVTTSTSGILIPEVLSAQIVDLMRNASLFTSAGVPVVPMRTNNLTIARVAEDPVFGWKQEGAEGLEGSMAFDSVSLHAKTIYGYAYLSLEAIHSAENLDSIVKRVFAEAMAKAIDEAFLYGHTEEGAEAPNQFAPVGIWNDEHVLAYSCTSPDTVYDALLKARAKILKHNEAPSCLAINASTDEAMQLLKDSQERYISMPSALASMSKVTSNVLASTGADANHGLVFDPSSMLIGIQNAVTIEQVQDEACLKRGLVAFRIYSMVDAAVIRPNGICKVTGI